MVSAGLLMPPQIMPEFNVCFKDKPIQARIVEAETKEYTGCVGRSGAKPDEYIKTWHAVLFVYFESQAASSAALVARLHWSGTATHNLRTDGRAATVAVAGVAALAKQ